MDSTDHNQKSLDNLFLCDDAAGFYHGGACAAG